MNCLRIVVGLCLLMASLAWSPAGTVVRFLTTVGDFDVELYDADKPVTVSNFLSYVEGGSYTNMIMHRVVPNFVMQGGEYNVANRGTTNPSLVPVPVSAPITNEYFVGKFYSNVFGTIAMAKTSDPDSATSQFFFNVTNNSAALDNTNNSGGFTVFGRVIAGTNVLNSFNIGPKNQLVKQVSLGGDISQLPVLYSADANNITFNDLIYVDVAPAPAYSPLKAAYNGLFEVPQAAGQQAPGFFSIAINVSGRFTGSLRLGTARYAFSGLLDTNGLAAAKATSGAQAPIYINVHIDPASGIEQMTGTINSATWVATLTAYRAAFDPRSNPATAYKGQYTMVLPSSGQAGQPAGAGFAAITVDSGGNVRVSGSLADGTAFTELVPLSADGHWPLYASLGGGSGSLSGWIVFTNRPAQGNEPADNLNGQVVWVEPATSKLFPGGFTAQLSATGDSYAPPRPGTPALSVTNLTVVFSGGGLAGPISDSVGLNAANRFVSTTNTLSIVLSAPAGLFSGSIKVPGSTRGTLFKGALLQSQNTGYGYFIQSGQVGEVSLGPSSPPGL